MKKKEGRPVEASSRLGPVALRRIALPADAPPPWCAATLGTDSPPPMEVQVADPDDLDWQAAIGVHGALAAQRLGMRGRSSSRSRGGKRRSSSGGATDKDDN